jgi:hypothetical protein
LVRINQLTLENWGRSKSTRKGNPSQAGGYASQMSTSAFQTPSKSVYREERNSSVQESAIEQIKNYQANPRSYEERGSSRRSRRRTSSHKKPYTDKSINETIMNLRKNLMGIDIHLGN